MKTILLLIFIHASISSSAQFLGKTYKESIDILSGTLQYPKYNVKEEKGSLVIYIEKNRKDSLLQKAICKFENDTCVKFIRFYKNENLEFHLEIFKNYKPLGPDKWQDFENKNICWSIVRHKDSFELILSYR